MLTIFLFFNGKSKFVCFRRDVIDLYSCVSRKAYNLVLSRAQIFVYRVIILHV